MKFRSIRSSYSSQHNKVSVHQLEPPPRDSPRTQSSYSNVITNTNTNTNTNSNSNSNSNSNDFTVVYRMGGDSNPVVSPSPSFDHSSNKNSNYSNSNSNNNVDDDVHRIVSAVKLGLRRSRKSKTKNNSSNNNNNSNKNNGNINGNINNISQSQSQQQQRAYNNATTGAVPSISSEASRLLADISEPMISPPPMRSGYHQSSQHSSQQQQQQQQQQHSRSHSHSIQQQQFHPHLQSQTQTQFHPQSHLQSQSPTTRRTVARDRDDSQNSDVAIKGSDPTARTTQAHNFRKTMPTAAAAATATATATQATQATTPQRSQQHRQPPSPSSQAPTNTNNSTARNRTSTTNTTNTKSMSMIKTKTYSQPKPSPNRISDNDNEDDNEDEDTLDDTIDDLFSEATSQSLTTSEPPRTHWSHEEDAGIHGFFHRMMFDESVMTASVEDEYNYIDGVSYSGTESSSSGGDDDDGDSASSASFNGREMEPESDRRNRHRHRSSNNPRDRDRDRDARKHHHNRDGDPRNHRDRNPDTDPNRRRRRRQRHRQRASASAGNKIPSTIAKNKNQDQSLEDASTLTDLNIHPNPTSATTIITVTSDDPLPDVNHEKKKCPSGSVSDSDDDNNNDDDNSDDDDASDNYSNDSDNYSNDSDDDAFVARRDEAAARASKAGLEIVAQLLAGCATEVSLDAGSIASAPMTTQQARKVAKPIAEALAKTTTLRTLVLDGPWNASLSLSIPSKHGSRSRSRIRANSGSLHEAVVAARNTVLKQILSDGLKPNTSVTTLVLRNNAALDRYAGTVFGNLFRTHSRLSRLELQNCSWSNFQQSSGWNCLLLGLQHSKSLKSISLEGTGLAASDLDGISLLVRYLGIVSVRLVGVNLHTIDDPDSLVLFFRTVQETTSIRELELSRNLLGGGGHPLRLLCKCLSGDTVELYSRRRDRHRGNKSKGIINSLGNFTSDVGGENHEDDDQVKQHHIQKLTLVDCGISRTSDVKMLTRALTTPEYPRDNPIVLSAMEVSGNQFGSAGAKVLQDWIKDHPNVKSLGMLSCNVGAKYLKIIKDQLRYNNSFLQTIGLSSDFSLAILDSVSTMENVFGNRNGGAASSAPTTSTAGLNPAATITTTITAA